MNKTVIITGHAACWYFVDLDWRKTAKWPDNPAFSDDGITHTQPKELYEIMNIPASGFRASMNHCLRNGINSL